MIKSNISPSKQRTITSSDQQQVSSLNKVDYFNQQEQTSVNTNYANQKEINQGSPGYAKEAKSGGYHNQELIAPTTGYSNQDVTTETKSGYDNASTINQAQNVDQVAANTTPLQNLIISIKDDQTGNILSSYQVCETLTLDEAQAIEKQSGVILKSHSDHPDKFNGFLGGGAFGRVYA